MESFKKLLPFVIVAIVFIVGGYFIGESGAIGDQGALLYKVQTTITNDDSGIIIRRWGGGCQIYSLVGGVETHLGTSNASQKDCHAIAPPLGGNEPSRLVGVSESDSSQQLSVSGNGDFSPKLVWVGGIGCVDFVVVDGRLVGFGTNISKRNCKEVAPPINTTTKTQ